MRIRSFSIVFVAVVASVVAGSPVRSTVVGTAPLLASYDAEVIPDNYIVVFKDHIKPGKQSLQGHFSWLTSSIQEANARAPAYKDSNKINHIYQDALVGYAGQFEPEILDRIRHSDEVAYVEKDSVVYALDTQSNAPWGLARISHRKPLGFGSFNKYVHDPSGGEGVTVYVVDTGVNIEHVDFEGRARWGKTVPLNDVDKDMNGHGTHVAGTIAGKRYGVAKGADVVAVKVLGSNGSGTMADVVMGVEFTVGEHRKAVSQAEQEGKKHRGSVANMSLGGGLSRALNLAVDAAVRAGVHYAVAAGNDNRDACNYSPASSPNAITVGATTITDERAWFSNFGKCVDVFAPGKDILSTWIGSRYQTNTISGTSMASPHVAGLAAYMLSKESGKLTGEQLKTKMIELATKGVVEDAGAGSPNVLIYNDPPKN
ncbi:proteinase B [Coemansia sp. RSA 1722]|nr:proteinase B [Coemansia sp. RSA 485]KAJ2601140.1 proteinase B [Coemansia sp. RSA 1722]KAJ2603026.1 proteinase B [Coemansia sp. RSA 1721]KAJ2640372.1 proteinase B [Coemansia sp. RSA 1286]